MKGRKGRNKQHTTISLKKVSWKSWVDFPPLLSTKTWTQGRLGRVISIYSKHPRTQLTIRGSSTEKKGRGHSCPGVLPDGLWDHWLLAFLRMFMSKPSWPLLELEATPTCPQPQTTLSIPLPQNSCEEMKMEVGFAWRICLNVSISWQQHLGLCQLPWPCTGTKWTIDEALKFTEVFTSENSKRVSNFISLTWPTV